MELKGVSLIGFADAQAGDGFLAINPTTNQTVQPRFSNISKKELDQAMRLAQEAFCSYGNLSGGERAKFLRHIADGLEANAAVIIERAQIETPLRKARLESEMGRTTGQLRLFAQLIEEGSWVDARLDSPDPTRKPPKPDVRSMLRPIGPVAIFGASNFPLAFSVPGGDTVSALAAGNPVVVKAHPAHPGVSELVGRTIRESVRACGLHEGVFSLIFGNEGVGTWLVQHPLTKAVGFTGSFSGGMALTRLASSRPDPIPCYAEMGSLNPVFILPKVLQQRAKEIATGIHGSFTLGSGQFCTKPGLVFLPIQPEAEDFRGEIKRLVQESTPQTLLTPGISAKYSHAVKTRNVDSKATVLASSKTDSANNGVAVTAFTTDMKQLQEEKSLSEEVFGPTTVLIDYQNLEELIAFASEMEGHLTATVHGTEEELIAAKELIKILETKVGRVVFNGYPTGVEVGHAMVHGGPFPATSDGRSSSVGTRAILRFARPFCYQDFPDSALPDELKSSNPLKILRMIDGAMTR